MSLLNDVTVYGDVDADLLKRVHRLFATPAGSVPFDRNFGVSPEILENLPAAAEGALIVEYAKKLNQYYPTLKISSLTFETANNTMTPKVVIAYV